MLFTFDEKILQAVRFDDRGLVPVITQEHSTGKVLMLAWANEASLRAALETGYMHYYSRSRQKLWRKGETSGNLQKLISLMLDCDGDAILASVDQTGNACHLEKPSCFFQELAPLTTGEKQ